MSIVTAIRAVSAFKNLSFEDAYGVFSEIMMGKATQSQVSALLVSLSMKGEVLDEVVGAARAMRDHVSVVSAHECEYLVDTCGTGGGDGIKLFNVSTAAALVAAGAGATVAKHGNRAMTSVSGSADVLEALGVTVIVPQVALEKMLRDIGIAFLFALSLHPSMKHAAPVRKEIGIRTIFNILGPLTNPASAPAQVLGVGSQKFVPLIAEALLKLGTKHSYVVCGDDGLGEVSLCGTTTVAKIFNGEITTITVTPQEFGFEAVSRSALAGGSATENAKIIRRIIDGEKGPHRNIVVLNAAFALVASGKACSIEEGITLSQNAIDSGAVLAKLSKLCLATADSGKTV